VTSRARAGMDPALLALIASAVLIVIVLIAMVRAS
jgi:hypothetical protein